MERWTQSRKKRQRYRRQRIKPSEAIDKPKPANGFTSDVALSRKDLPLLGKALRDGWAVSKAALRHAPTRCAETCSDDENPASLRIAAARILIRMHRENLKKHVARVQLVFQQRMLEAKAKAKAAKERAKRPPPFVDTERPMNAEEAKRILEELGL